MSEPVINEVSGLQLSNNDFSASPPGSTSIAMNVVMPQKGIAQPRNGMARGSSLPSTHYPRSATEFLGSLIVSSGPGETSTANGLGWVGGGSVTEYSSFSAVFNPVDNEDNIIAPYRMKFGFAAQYLHFCTETGPRTNENVTTQPRVSGLQRMPDPLAFANKYANNNFVAYNTNVAYRTVLRRPTQTGQSLLSPPSSRFVIANRIYLPIGALTKASSVATATMPVNTFIGLSPGDTFLLTPGEAAFPSTTYTVSTCSANVMTFAITSGTATNTVAQDANCGPRGFGVNVWLPLDAQAGDFVRTYRSQASSSTAVAPDDELFLTNEVELVQGDVDALVISVDDTTPFSLATNPLYTNAFTGEGAQSANLQPPIYRDITNYDSRTFYANTTGQQALNIELLGVGGPNGIQDGDTITVSDSTNTVTLTFKTSPGTVFDVQIVSSGLPEQNVQATTQNLIQRFLVNTTTLGAGSNFGWAMYSNTGLGDGQGKVLLERVDFVDDQLQVTVSRPLTWVPAMDPSVPTLSDNSRTPNALVYSKPGQPESVPALNYMSVGAKNFAIRRIFGLKNALLIFKEGDGIWALTGLGGSYILRQVSTANILAPDCAAVFADSAWAWTDQGILRVTDTGGCEVKSRPIEVQLNEIDAQFPDECHELAFAVPYETERRIMFYMPVEAEADRLYGVRLEAFCYCLATDSWTRFNAQALCGVVTEQPRLWLGVQDVVHPAGRLLQERKGSLPTYLDMADADWTSSITAYSLATRTVTLSDAAGVRKGSGISQSVGGIIYRTKISGTTANPLVFTVAESCPFAVAACTIYDPYPVSIRFLPIGNPASRKVLERLNLFYKENQYCNFYGKLTLATDQVQEDTEIAAPFLGFGLTPFGQGQFGNPSPLIVDTNPVGAQWVNAAQFFPGFELEEVWAKFKLQGVYSLMDSASGPAGRGR